MNKVMAQQLAFVCSHLASVKLQLVASDASPREFPAGTPAVVTDSEVTSF